MSDSTTFFGLDVHKDSIFVALYLPGEKDPIEWKEANTEASLRRLARRLKRRASGQLQGCYEAGGCGYAVQRKLAGQGVKCQVVAPSLIPSKPGERVKTDRRDARKLGQLVRAGLLTEVHPPTREQEADRDLVRARDDAREDRMRARHRLSKFARNLTDAKDGFLKDAAYLIRDRDPLYTRKFCAILAGAYVEGFLSGDSDPDPDILRDTHPLVFYGLDTNIRLWLVKTGSGEVRISF